MIRRCDREFRVDYTYRLRFADDILGGQAEELVGLMPAEGRARLLTVIDGGLMDAAADVVTRVEALPGRFADRLENAGPVLRVEGGEACKNSDRVVDQVLDAIDQSGLDRQSYLMVIGGGAVLDAVGLAAAQAHRGVRLIRLPTTTLSQADSGIGVKNAVNRYGKKNWQGTFGVPWAVINDQRLLTTLPDREFRAGFSEAVKVAVVKDPAYFDELASLAEALANREPGFSQRAIERSARLHLDHITLGGDPFETQQARPLDFGHWSAHKLESMTHHRLSHGEAVAIGVAIDCVYSAMTHQLAESEAERVCGCLEDLGLTLSHPLLQQCETLLQGLEEFRQHLGGQLTVTMLDGIGQPRNVHEIDPVAMTQAIRQVAERAK